MTIILDNRITGMTGHQENPGSGFTAQGDPAPEVDIPAICRAINIKHVITVNPNHLDEFKAALDGALKLDEPSVIIKVKYQSDEEKCIGCKACLKAGCPAIHFNRDTKKAFIGADCLGCGVCAQICPKNAIKKQEREAR